MKSKEELDALKDEELEQVAAGKSTIEEDPNNPGYPVGPPNEDTNYCEYRKHRWDGYETLTCVAPITSRTEDKCKDCAAQGLFTLK